MVKTILPVQRNKDEYEFQDDSNQPVLPTSPVELENAENIPETVQPDIDFTKCDGFMEMKEQVYQDKLAGFKKQLQQLKEGTHPEYNRKLKKLENAYKERLRLNVIWRDHMSSIIEKEYVAEKKAISKEFEEKKIELKDTLIADLEEKRKNIENQRLSIDISGDQTEPKPAMTRKLRRRPNDPLPVPDKRRKNPPIQLNYLLDDRDIDDDLREINAAKYSCVKKGGGASDRLLIDSRIEDGKLMYEKKWFLRGQPVFIEGRNTPKFPAIISAIRTEALWVKKTIDGSKVRIQLSQLIKGKFSIKRRAS
ncbi:sin3 histone deacetylase corepressor complex component SDS3 [Planococcus citri]|uniref:sin3 histone deacetylase corepressor complex component SDS3 n=1 Tax=Planococcus citri TaxID=170843 RepID=UPI0031F93A14